MTYPIYQVDAFTDRVFGGNPAAVMPLEQWLPDATLLALAMENHLSETAFLVRLPESSDADYHIRWFTPGIEVPLCVHATLASAWVLFNKLGWSGDRLGCLAICPGMVVGPRDVRPTSTGLLLMMARVPVAIVPGGGIPIVDSGVIAQAHRRALGSGEPGRRYAVVGPYVSYAEMARLVGRVAGWPRAVRTMPESAEGPMRLAYSAAGRVSRRVREYGSSAVVSGAFLRLHVSGRRADAAFGLVHPEPIGSIRAALEDARRSGRAPGLRLVDEGSGGR